MFRRQVASQGDLSSYVQIRIDATQGEKYIDAGIFRVELWELSMEIIDYKADLEHQCQLALDIYTDNPCDETYSSAMAKLDGIYLGIMVVIRSIGEDPVDNEALEVARQVTQLYQATLVSSRL